MLFSFLSLFRLSGFASVWLIFPADRHAHANACVHSLQVIKDSEKSMLELNRHAETLDN